MKGNVRRSIFFLVYKNKNIIDQVFKQSGSSLLLYIKSLPIRRNAVLPPSLL